MGKMLTVLVVLVLMAGCSGGDDDAKREVEERTGVDWESVAEDMDSCVDPHGVG